MKEMLERQNDLKTQAEEIVNTAKAENRAVTEEEKASFDNIMQEINNIENTLQMEEEINNMEVKEIKRDENISVEAKEEKLFENYIRGVVTNTGEMTPGNNGAVIPTTIADRIIRKVYEISPVLEKSTRYNVKGKLEIPVAGNGLTVAYKSEFSELTSSTSDFTAVELTGYLAGALSLISNSLINNAQFDIVSFVIEVMAESIAKFIENELINGTANKVAGLSGITQNVTTASTSAITADEVVKLYDSIKSVYKSKSMFLMHPTTLTALRLLKGQDGHYLLNDDITAPYGYRLLGAPVYISDNMPQIAAGNSVIIYGDLKCLATNFHENMDIQVLREHFATQHATGVVAWVEFDGKVADTQGLAALKMKTSE